MFKELPEMMLERFKVILFLNFLHKIFVWTHEVPIGDFGGRGLSPYVLLNSVTTAKLLRTLPNESERFLSARTQHY